MRSKKNCIKVATTSEHHRALVEAAQREQVSMNQYCVYMLALSVATEIEDDGFDDLFKANGAPPDCQS